MSLIKNLTHPTIQLFRGNVNAPILHSESSLPHVSPTTSWQNKTGNGVQSDGQLNLTPEFRWVGLCMGSFEHLSVYVFCA